MANLTHCSTLTLWTDPFQSKGCLVSFYYYHTLYKIPVFNANSVDPNQTPHSAASDLSLHCLPMPILWDATVLSTSFRKMFFAWRFILNENALF